MSLERGKDHVLHALRQPRHGGPDQPGCPRKQREIKLLGGSTLTTGPSMVGRKNADLALCYRETEGLNVAAKDFGGSVGRRMHYFPASGKGQRVFLKHSSDQRIVEEERNDESHIGHAPVEGEIELFD
jgi:chemotaxis protein CheD